MSAFYRHAQKESDEVGEALKQNAPKADEQSPIKFYNFAAQLKEHYRGAR